MERVLIVAKTRMSSGVCIGGLTREQNRNVRLIPPDRQNHPLDTKFDVGQVWDLEIREANQSTPPHIEDVIVTGGKRVGHVSNIHEILLQRVQPWQGGPEVMYDHLLTIAYGRGYISENNNIPGMSTGYWIPDKPLHLHFDQQKPYYRVNSAHGVLTIPFVGFADPIQQIPEGSLVRVSLARWFKPTGVSERRCYLQLSCWYL
jgi:ATP-dependent DNA helicase RecQ